MLADRSPHTVHVDAWLESAFDGEPRTAERWLCQTLQALWQRSKTSLGAPASNAIFARVTADARHRHPVLEHVSLAVDNSNVERIAGDVDEAMLRDAARYLLVELLTAVAALTANVLTPALHETLHASPEAHRMHALATGREGDT